MENIFKVQRRYKTEYFDNQYSIKKNFKMSIYSD